MADDKQLSKFLTDIDDIESIIKGLASKDDVTTSEASKKADEYLEKHQPVTKKKPHDNTGVNRSVINQKAFDEMGQEAVTGPPSGMQPPGAGSHPASSQQLDQAAFMVAMEQDAEERHKRKKEAEKQAMVMKETGNAAFKAGDYEAAVKHYSEALTVFKDTTVLWTNRAQAYIKLGEYDKALVDCDWATRVFENCLKAYIHQGKAHLGLKQYEKAVESYEKAMKIDPTKEKLITAYIKEVEHAERTADEERRALEAESAGDWHVEGLVSVMEKVNTADQLPMYYSGGLRILIQSLNNTNERTLFRTHGGMQLIQNHPCISKCFSASPRSLSREEFDLCSSSLDTMLAACTENEENWRQFLDLPEISQKLLRFLESKVKLSRQMNVSAISLLLKISESEAGREKLVGVFNVARLLTCVFTLVAARHAASSVAVSLINNLALSQKFKIQIRESVCDVLPSFEHLMVEGSKYPDVLASCVSTVTNLCADPVVRKKIVESVTLWQAALKVLDNHTSRSNQPQSAAVLSSVLGLLMNLTVSPSEQSKQHECAVCVHCCRLLASEDTRVRERSLGLLGHLVVASESMAGEVVREGGVQYFLEAIKAGDECLVKPAVKCLTACTTCSPSARSQVVSHGSGVRLLHSLLNHQDEGIVGNVALCLGHCLEEEMEPHSSKVSASLTETRIMMDLLVLARDGKRHTVQKNCAILIAKLCKGDSRHLEKLRELDGLGILHDVLKNDKD